MRKNSSIMIVRSSAVNESRLTLLYCVRRKGSSRNRCISLERSALTSDGDSGKPMPFLLEATGSDAATFSFGFINDADDADIKPQGFAMNLANEKRIKVRASPLLPKVECCCCDGSNALVQSNNEQPDIKAVE